MTTRSILLLALVGALGCSSKAPVDIGACSTSQECPPEQVCRSGRCAVLEEGRAVGTFECLRDDKDGLTGRTDAVARVNGKSYSFSTYVTCQTDKNSVVENLYFSILVSGANKGTKGPDALQIFLDEATGLPKEPKVLEGPGATPSKTNSGFLTEDDVGGNIAGLRIVAWVESGTISIDEWPPSSGLTLHGRFDVKLVPAKAGPNAGAECTTLADCGDSPVGKCLDIAGGAPFCWNECDAKDVGLFCDASRVCIGYNTPLGSPRSACVQPCTAAGACENAGLKCKTGTNGVKGCWR